MKKKNTPKFRAYMLRTCGADMSAYNGFRWPASGEVIAPDWDPAPECGNGLHGLLWGAGDGVLLDWDADAKWLVCGINEWVDIDGDKIKAPRATVIHVGDRKSATDAIIALGADPSKCVGAFVTSGDFGTSTSGYRGTSASGDYGTSTSGYGGTSTSGYRGTSTSGYGGTSTSGYRGTSTSGDYGTSTSGDGGTSTSGDRGTSTSGDGGTLIIKWHDGNRFRIAVAYVGEDGIKPNTPYRLDDAGKFVEVKP